MRKTGFPSSILKLNDFPKFETPSKRDDYRKARIPKSTNTKKRVYPKEHIPKSTP
jgi:hypothetical protein